MTDFQAVDLDAVLDLFEFHEEEKEEKKKKESQVVDTQKSNVDNVVDSNIYSSGGGSCGPVGTAHTPYATRSSSRAGFTAGGGVLRYARRLLQDLVECGVGALRQRFDRLVTDLKRVGAGRRDEPVDPLQRAPGRRDHVDRRRRPDAPRLHSHRDHLGPVGDRAHGRTRRAT